MPGHFTFFTHQIDNGKALFDENESRHALQVLRYGVGSQIEFTDGKGFLYKGRITETSKKFFVAQADEVIEPANLSKLSLAVGIIKHTDRLEWMVEKCCELGVESLILMQTENTVKARVSIERLERICISALKQSHGCRLPKLILEDFKTTVNRSAENRFICHCRAELQNKSAKPNDLKGETLVLIGPEGDFSVEEVKMTHELGFTDLALGNTVLRTETAAMAVAGAYNLIGGNG
jgi:16S rRNA (uracil1498-N3)-methyltransferase